MKKNSFAKIYQKIEKYIENTSFALTKAIWF